jgi:hypothetical protein
MSSNKPSTEDVKLFNKRVTDDMELVKGNDVLSIYQDLDKAEKEYEAKQITLDQLKMTVNGKKLILEAMNRVNQIVSHITEEELAKKEEAVQKTFHSIVKQMRAQEGNADYPMILITRVDGTALQGIKLLLNKKLPADRYIHGKAIKAFTNKDRLYQSATFNGKQLERSYLDKFLFLRLTKQEATMAKLAAPGKAIAIEDPDAKKWISIFVAYQCAASNSDIYGYDNDFQLWMKMIASYEK